MKLLARWLPALATLALLVIALLAPVRRVGAGADAVFTPSCDLLLEQNGSSATWPFTGSAGVTQPFAFTGNVAACSLGFDFPYYSGGVVRIRKWNAAGLMADPTTLALRTYALDASHMQWSHVGVYFDPPVVLRESPDVAEGVGPDLALEFQNLYNPEVAHYDPDGPPSLPVARQFAANPLAAQSPLPGNHPVLDHRLCGGTSVLQDLIVTQSVIRSDSAVGDGATYELAQHFRVPVSTRLHWIEFALKGGSTAYGDHGTIAVYEGNGDDVPPVTLPAPLVSANFDVPYDYYYTLPAWRTHYDFDGIPTLRTDRDYWLVMRTFGKYTLEARRRTGSEGPAYNATMGSLLVRSTSVVPWTAMPNLTLDFRTVGEATYAVSVAPPHAAAGALRLAVAPSPARGPVTVSWAGARGDAIRFDVVDARGRRVGGGDAAANTGRWSWNGASADGRALPAGVYFVRAHDAANTATQRVVLVR